MVIGLFMLLISCCLVFCVFFKKSITIFKKIMTCILQYSFYSLSPQRPFYPGSKTQLFRVPLAQEPTEFKEEHLQWGFFSCFCGSVLSLAAGVLEYLYQ